MTSPRVIGGVEVPDGNGEKRLVRKGDLVELLPIGEGCCSSKDSHEFLERWLGKGPYKISWVGEWPCGKKMLYLDMRDGKSGGTCSTEPSAHASDFGYVGTSLSHEIYRKSEKTVL